LAIDGLLLDTNAISETRRRAPFPGLMSLLERWGEERIFISVLTVGELVKGAESLRLRGRPGFDETIAWIGQIEFTFEDRMLPVTQNVARLWGIMSADRSRPVTDTLIAATAKAHDLTIVTRNRRDFANLEVEVIDPWEASP
jgi:predicted nucleic acid-binding protein